MTRGNDNAPAECVDRRAEIANSLQVRPDAVVSLHAYTAASSVRGFTINYPYPPLSGRKGSPATQLAQIVFDEMTARGIPAVSTGPRGRADNAFLNLVEYPVVEVELGNMSNPDDARIMMAADGRQTYANAVTAGIVAFLQAQPR
jgi:N-acetylmuramoyl-L-alanine amidase